MIYLLIAVAMTADASGVKLHDFIYLPHVITQFSSRKACEDAKKRIYQLNGKNHSEMACLGIEGERK